MAETWNDPYRNEQTRTTGGDAGSTFENAEEQARRFAERAKEKVSAAGRQAENKINEQREHAARGLDQAASTLHETADNLPGVKKVTNFTHRTANRIQATADYVREHDARAVMTSIEDSVRRHPGEAMAVAAIVGFLLGRMFRGGSNYA